MKSKFKIIYIYKTNNRRHLKCSQNIFYIPKYLLFLSTAVKYFSIFLKIIFHLEIHKSLSFS